MSKKSSKTATVGTLKGKKAKEFPNIADALTKPLGEAPVAADTQPTGDDKAAVPEAMPNSKAKTKTKVKAKEEKPKRDSALDAAARVLDEEAKPMNCQDLIETMASNGYWSSPKGLTPAATLYAAILREIKLKGNEARFKKTDRGQFAFAK